MGTYNQGIRKKIFGSRKRAILMFVMAAAFAIPLSTHALEIRAAEIEDCDLDGYDDHTGNPVPWIGFDSTKGQEIPAGWDGSTTYKSQKAFEDAQKKDSGTDPGEENKSSGTSSSGTSSQGSGAPKPAAPSADRKSTPSMSAGNGSKSGTTNNASSNTPSETRKGTATQKKEQDKGSTTKSTVKKETKTQNAKTEETQSADAKTEKKEQDKGKTSKKASGTKASETKNENPSSEGLPEENPERVSGETVDGISEGGVGNESPADSGEIWNTVGNLAVSEEDGSAIHAGSSLVIRGSGFAGNVNEIDLEIHSDHAINLGSVSTAEDGSFEKTVYIPEDLEEGQHEIILKYRGQTIAAQPIHIGPKIADTFVKALTVGFSTQNTGLIPGIGILAGLFAAGAATVLVNKALKGRGNGR